MWVLCFHPDSNSTTAITAGLHWQWVASIRKMPLKRQSRAKSLAVSIQPTSKCLLFMRQSKVQTALIYKLILLFHWSRIPLKYAKIWLLCAMGTCKLGISTAQSDDVFSTLDHNIRLEHKIDFPKGYWTKRLKLWQLN